MASSDQIFGSALRNPWALVVFGSNAPNGKRPATTVAFLTDDCGDHYLGGLVEFYRKRVSLKLEGNRYVVKTPGDATERWHFRYKHAKRIPKSDVLHIFQIANKSCFGGPTKAEIAAARKALPITQAEAA